MKGEISDKKTDIEKMKDTVMNEMKADISKIKDEIENIKKEIVTIHPS